MWKGNVLIKIMKWRNRTNKILILSMIILFISFDVLNEFEVPSDLSVEEIDLLFHTNVEDLGLIKSMKMNYSIIKKRQKYYVFKGVYHYEQDLDSFIWVILSKEKSLSRYSDFSGIEYAKETLIVNGYPVLITSYNGCSACSLLNNLSEKKQYVPSFKIKAKTEHGSIWITIINTEENNIIYNFDEKIRLEDIQMIENLMKKFIFS